eukprot:366342-Chlamydomonas_euryale.AAC.8
MRCQRLPRYLYGLPAAATAPSRSASCCHGTFEVCQLLPRYLQGLPAAAAVCLKSAIRIKAAHRDMPTDAQRSKQPQMPACHQVSWVGMKRRA